MKTNLLKVLIADDHPVVREGLVALISRCPDMRVVAEASNGQEAVEQFVLHRPDVALIDLRMGNASQPEPEMDGVDTIAAILKEVPTARLLLLTIYDADEDVHRAFRAGAKAYLLKDTPRDELLDSLRAVHDGQTVIPPAIALKLAAYLTATELTSRETEVLRHMAEGKNNKDISSALYVSVGTIKSHVNAILRKLNATDRTQAITTALKRGLVRLD